MSHIFEDLPQRESLATCWRGTIARAPSDELDTVDVLIDAFDATHRHGPARWGPRNDTGGLPDRGDVCIVVFDEQDRPYVIGWWPDA
jgi:hypothetical protein